MKIIGCFLCILAGYSAAAAQSAGPGYTVAGVVVDEDSGQPVSHVKVSIRNPGDQRTQNSLITAGSGTFRFDGLKAGKFLLAATRHQGFAQTFGQRNSGNSFGVAVVTGPDQDTSHLVFRLVGAGVVTGRVIDESGDPVSEATVRIMRTRVASGRKITSIYGAKFTNDQGEYRFWRVPTGDYYLSAVGRPWYAPQEEEPLDADGKQAALPVATFAVKYYPDTLEASEAQPVHVSAGTEARADFTMTTVNSHKLTLRLAEENAGEAKYRAAGIGGSQMDCQSGEIFDASSAYLPPGRYTVEVIDRKRNWARNSVDLTGKGDTSNRDRSRPERWKFFGAGKSCSPMSIHIGPRRLLHP